MKRLKTTDIRNALRERHAAPPPPPAGEFWAQANARLDDAHREAMRRARLTRAQFRMVWTAVAAAAGFMLVISITWLNPTAPLQPEPHATSGSAVLALDVQGDCQSVMTLEGRKNKGTIILISGMTPD